MAFDESKATNLRLRRAPGPSVLLEWDTTEPAGTPFQVYADGVLAWSGTDRLAVLPMPASWTTYHVGSVAAGEERTSFASSLTPIPGGGNRPRLTWAGVTGAASYRIYGEATPGGGVSYTTPLATVAATLGTGTYAWTGPPRSAGSWTFAVKPVGSDGVEGTAATVAVTIAGPPRPPAPDSTGKRLRYAYNAGTGVATLAWNASPA